MSVTYLNLHRDRLRHVNSVLTTISSKKKVILYFHGGLSSDGYMKRDLGPILSNTLFSSNFFKRDETAIVFMQYNASLFDRKIKEKLKQLKATFPEGEEMAKVFNKSSLFFLVEQKQKSKSKAFLTEQEREDYFEEELKLYKKELLFKDLEQAGLKQNDLKKLERFLGNKTTNDYHKTSELFENIVRSFKNKTAHGEETFMKEALRIRFLNAPVRFLAQRHWKKVYSHAESMWETRKGRHFLQGLENIFNQSGERVEVNLVSHSAGSIPISYLLKNLHQAPNNSIKNVILTVPAIRMAKFQENILPSKHLFSNIKMYLLDDFSEREENLFKGIFNKSLLYFVAGIAEVDDENSDMTILGMHRYYKDVKPYNTYDNPKYGNPRLCKEYFTEENKMTFVTLKDEVSDDFGMQVITSKGASHSETKLAHESPELADDILKQLLPNFIPSKDNYEDWNRQIERLNKWWRRLSRRIRSWFI